MKYFRIVSDSYPGIFYREYTESFDKHNQKYFAKRCYTIY